MPRLTRLLAVLLLASACTPKSEPKLDGAPGEAPGASGPSVPEDSLAGAPPPVDLVLPRMIGLAPPPGAKVHPGCEHIIAPDYDNPPPMACLYLQADGEGAAAASPTDPVLLAALAAANWKPVRAAEAERYFEREKTGTDCADLMALVALDAKQTAALLKADSAAAAPKGRAWRAYAIPASTRETCGADRMRP